MEVATVLTVYGIETIFDEVLDHCDMQVATVLTVYGIETQQYFVSSFINIGSCNSTYRLRY